MVEQFIAEAKALDGVVFARLDTYLDWWSHTQGAPSPEAS